MGEEDKGYLHSSESGMSGFPRKNHHEAKLSFSFLLIGVPEATTTLATTPGASRSGKRLAQRSPGSKRDWGWADWVQSHLVLPEGGKDPQEGPVTHGDGVGEGQNISLWSGLQSPPRQPDLPQTLSVKTTAMSRTPAST